MLNCMHMFCDWCISSWEKIIPQCPICRVPTTSKILCLPFNNHILKIIERAPEDIKTAYKELDTARTRDGPKGIIIAIKKKNQFVLIIRYYSLVICNLPILTILIKNKNCIIKFLPIPHYTITPLRIKCNMKYIKLLY